MTVDEKKNLKEHMTQELLSLEKNIKELQKLCEPISPQCALGDLARFELMHDQNVSEQALAQAQIRKNKLQYTLSKIDQDNFGLCVECEEEIPYERLILLPESSLCIKCASQTS